MADTEDWESEVAKILSVSEQAKAIKDDEDNLFKLLEVT